MYDVKEMYKNKINSVTSQENLNKLNKKKKVWAFVSKTLFIIDLIQTRENQKNSLHLNDEFKKITSGDYSYVSREQFLKVIKKESDLNECLKYLKEEKLIECRKVDDKEYYVHIPKADQNRCTKAYKLTNKCKKALSNTSQEEFDAFINSIKVEGIERRKYVPPTPKKQLQKINCEYWFNNTKENIIHVLNNNLELEFHPTTVNELIEEYNKQRIEDGEKVLNRQQIEEQIAQKIDQYANKDFSYNVRLYSAFTNTPRNWRKKYVKTKEGNNIEDLFDIPSSVINILPIVCRIELRKNGCTKDQFEQFLLEERMLNNQLQRRYDKNDPVHIYNIIGSGEYTKQQIKDSVMTVFFSNNKSFENVANIEKTKTGKLRHTPANAVRLWLKNNYPIMFDIVSHFEQKFDKTAKGYKKFKSQFWKAFQQIETELMCELNVRVEKKYGAKIYNLHDGCFMDALYSTKTSDQMKEYCRAQYDVLKQEICKRIDEKYPLQEQKSVTVKEQEQLDVDALMAGYEESKDDTTVPAWIAKQVPTKKEVLERIERNKDFDFDEYANQKIYEDQQKQKAIAWAREQKNRMGVN